MTDLSAPTTEPSSEIRPGMGFWQSWAMSVGVMVGSGIFLLPAVLAPYGSISLVGWLVTSSAVILLALILGRLARRAKGAGGPYAYAREGFGDLVGFLIGWGYWLGVIFGVTAIAVAFAGYLGAMVPLLGSTLAQALVAAAGIWAFTLVNLKGISEAAAIQLLLTILKLAPLLVIILLAPMAGSAANLPDFNPQQLPSGSAIAATALLTMWAFIGIEAAVVPSADVQDPERTLPKAIVSAALTVAGLYIAATLAVMLLVPAEQLAQSEAPFVDAALTLGPWGAGLIGLGALISTAGALNGNIFLCGQMPMAMALDGLAPKRFGERNRGRAPGFALVISSVLSTLLLVVNFTDGLVGAFTFLISMSTLSILAPYAVSALVELRVSWRSAKGWALIAILTVVYIVLAAAGSGVRELALGLLLLLAGLPVYYLVRNHP